MNDKDNILPPPSKKEYDYDQSDWTVHNKELSKDEICVAIKDGLPKSIQYQMEDKDKDCRSLHHTEWCDLLNSFKAKYN